MVVGSGRGRAERNLSAIPDALSRRRGALSPVGPERSGGAAQRLDSPLGGGYPVVLTFGFPRSVFHSRSRSYYLFCITCSYYLYGVPE